MPPFRETYKGLHVGPLGGGAEMGVDLEKDLQILDAWGVDQWAQDPTTTTGLTYGYSGGVYDDGADWQRAADATIALDDDATNYVERDPATGTVSQNAVGFTHANVPMAKITTLNGKITAHEDWRPMR